MKNYLLATTQMYNFTSRALKVTKKEEKNYDCVQVKCKVPHYEVR